MGKLIKYEWKKQRTSRMVIFAMLAVGILAFIWGMIFDDENVNAAGIIVVLMFSMSFLVLLYTGIESILVLNRDLRTKQSYMLWMVPKSIWEILGSKFISAILQMFVVFAFLFFIAWAEVIFIGFLAVIMARTVLLRSRFAGLVAVILFFVLNYAVEKGLSLLHCIPAFADVRILAGWNPLDIVYYVLVCLVMFGVSGWVADKKLSV